MRGGYLGAAVAPPASFGHLPQAGGQLRGEDARAGPEVDDGRGGPALGCCCRFGGGRGGKRMGASAGGGEREAKEEEEEEEEEFHFFRFSLFFFFESCGLESD